MTAIFFDIVFCMAYNRPGDEMLMKKAAIFYFSGTGNTWWVSGRICKALKDKGIECTMHSVEQTDPEQAAGLIESCNIAGFGFPVYASDLPYIMKEFMKKLKPGCHAVDSFIFCTQWMFSGNGAKAAAGFLDRQLFNVKWAEHFLMPNNVCVTVMPLPYTNDMKRIRNKLSKTSKRVERFASGIAEGRKQLRGFNPFSSVLGLMQRLPYRLFFNRLRNDVGFDTDKCNACGRCEKICPARNILIEEGKPHALGKCILCVRCYNFCPVSAVKYMGFSHREKRGKPYRGPVESFKPEKIKQ